MYKKFFDFLHMDMHETVYYAKVNKMWLAAELNTMSIFMFIEY